MSRLKILCGLGCLLMQVLPVQGQDLVWVRQMSGTDYVTALAVAVDDDGNVYTTGAFSGTVDFDPGPGAVLLTSNEVSATFVSKLDSVGNLVWVRSLGSSVYAASVAVDESGNVVTTGSFTDIVDFDPGAGVFTLTPVGARDVFVSKLDSAGNFMWARQLGGMGYEWSNDVALDANGNVYTTGYFGGAANSQADFDPGPGVFNLTLPGPSAAASTDIFVSKLDSAGNFVWARRLGGTGDDQANGIAVDADGNVYTTGVFLETADFDPGLGVFSLAAAGSKFADIFVSKLDSAGNFVWARRMGGTGGEWVEDIAVDDDGNVYTTGSFGHTADFDPSEGVYNLTLVGVPCCLPPGNYGNAIFVSKLDSAGNFVWARRMGGTQYARGHDVAVDEQGSVYTTGVFGDAQSTIVAADFDPGAGVFNLTPVGESDVFVSKLDSTGNFVWARQIGGSKDDVGTGVAVDRWGSVYTTGTSEGSVDFLPFTGIPTLNSAGRASAFVVKYRTEPTSGQPPVISDGGIVLATLLPTVNTVSPLSIISVFGQNFSSETILNPRLNSEGGIETVLGGTCLLMNGEALPIYAVTPGQINAQISATKMSGPASFTVIANCGTAATISSAPVMVESGAAQSLTSDVATVTVEEATPGFFLFNPVTSEGFIAARFNGSLTQLPVPVAPEDLFPNDSWGPSRPAQPGDVIVLYGTGWGDTAAALEAGELATGAAPLLLDANPMVSFGGMFLTQEDILYVGVTPQTAGLYQLVIRVPATALPGKNQVVLTVYGKSTPIGPVVPVAGP